MATGNRLAEHNAVRRREIEAVRDRHVAAHLARAAQPPAEAPLPALERRIAAALSARWGKGRLEPTFDVVERARHGGDLALRFPQLLKEGGPKVVIRDHLPWIVETLRGADLADAIARVETAGMYVNVTLSDRWLLDGAGAAAERGPGFCRSAAMAEGIVVIDYSSPNIAKTLHAGHIRSTIVGHVLGNLYEACGALVHRVNHINDFGGFGFTLEGWERFGEVLAALPNDNARLLEIYKIRRVLERVVAAKTGPAAMDAADRELVAGVLPGAASAEAVAAGFADYVAASDARFAALEAGEPREVELWRAMVGWSLADFEGFYDKLAIHFDLVIGESFYFAAGDSFVDACLADGRAIVFSDADADAAVAKLDARLAAKKIGEPERDTLAAAVRKDVGAVVVPLDREERLVVRRADGRSIYATRDLGAVVLRREIFGMNAGIYVTGQEQQVHFDRVFRAAAATGIAPVDAVRFLHVWFGFYVDSKTGKKLSSRDSVANVTQLLDDARAYFRSRVGERAVGDADVESAARELAIGSLVFNDLKQDIKGPRRDRHRRSRRHDRRLREVGRGLRRLRRVPRPLDPAARRRGPYAGGGDRALLARRAGGRPADDAAAAAGAGRCVGARVQPLGAGAPPPRDRHGLQFLLRGGAGDRGRRGRPRAPADHRRRLPGAGRRPAALPRHLPRGDLIAAPPQICRSPTCRGDTPPRDRESEARVMMRHRPRSRSK